MTKPTIGGGLSSPPGVRDFVPQRAIAGRVIRLLLISATARHCDASKTPMPELANSRHERFAQGVVNGLTGAEAYRRVAGSNSKIPAAPTPPPSARSRGPRSSSNGILSRSRRSTPSRRPAGSMAPICPAVHPLPRREPLSVSNAPADGARLADPVGKGRHGEIRGRRARVQGPLPLFPGFQIRAPRPALAVPAVDAPAVAVLNAD